MMCCVHYLQEDLDFEGKLILLYLCSEGTNGFITFTIEGDPAPTVQWFKGFKDLSVEQRLFQNFKIDLIMKSSQDFTSNKH